MKKISIRSIFVAPKGKLLVQVDLSQAESWIVAYASGDQNMIHSLNHSDIHADTASSVVVDPENYCQHVWLKANDTHTCINCKLEVIKPARYIGKRTNHASGYRMKAPRFVQVVNKDSDKPPYITITLNQGKLYQQRWHARYPNVSKVWWPDIEYRLNRDGRKLTTCYGRTRQFFQKWGDELFKEATAFEPQSTVADHFNGAIHPLLGIKGGLLEIYRQLIQPYPERCIINQSHDSCIVEVPKGEAREVGLEMQRLIRRPIVMNGVEFTIPVDGEIGERWGELEPLKVA